MKKRKIIFISNNPITVKIKELFHLAVFEENGFELECWDLSPFVDIELSNLPDKLSLPNIFTISSFSHMEQKVLQNNPDNTVFLSGLDDNYTYRKIFKLLKKQNFIITTIFPYAGMQTFHYTLIHKIKRAFSSNIFKKISGLVKNSYYSFYKKIYHIDLTTYFFSSAQPCSVAINHPDYEHFIKIKAADTSIQKEAYIVFLDTYMPLHPDLVTFNALKYVRPKNYQAAMCNFFEKLEQKFNAEVIIAAHPKARYDNFEFGKRKIIKYKTAELVKNAELVVSHMSNSTAYALLFDKPVIFITTNEVNSIPKFAFKLHCYVQQLNKRIYNIDQCSIQQMDFSKINDENRKKYLYSYLTSPETENISNKDILVAEYSKIFDLIEVGKKL